MRLRDLKMTRKFGCRARILERNLLRGVPGVYLSFETPILLNGILNRGKILSSVPVSASARANGAPSVVVTATMPLRTIFILLL